VEEVTVPSMERIMMGQEAEGKESGKVEGRKGRMFKVN